MAFLEALLNVLSVTGSIAIALLAGVAVFIIEELRQRWMRGELIAARSAAALAESRLADLRTAHSELTQRLDEAVEERQLSSNERASALATLTEVREQLETAQGSLETFEARLNASEARSTELAKDVAIAQTQVAESGSAVLEARENFERADSERGRLAHEVIQIRAHHAALQKEVEGLRDLLSAQKSWVEEQTQKFRTDVLAAATQVIEERGKTFTESNKQQVDAVISPFKDQLAEFRRRVDDIYSSESRDRGQLHQQIEQLTSLNRTVSEAAERLVNALTITSKSTGDWGETILEKILEDSALRRDQDYRLQHAIEGSEGESYQPDAVIFLPDRRQLIIDAKVSNKAWTEFCGAEDDAQRDALFEQHLSSLRAHIKGLAGKDYARSPDLDTVDFVLMFVPVEAALLTAMARDPSLYSEAYRSKIILVVPSTLMAVVKLVEGIWTFQKRKESADEIAEAGRKLYEKLSTFATTFLDVGRAIGKAQESFEIAQKQLATGKGNAIGLAQKMVELGVTPGAGKALPLGLVEGAGSEPEPDPEPKDPQ